MGFYLLLVPEESSVGLGLEFANCSGSQIMFQSSLMNADEDQESV